VKRRSLLALAGLGLLTPAALAACSSTTDSKDSSGSGSALPDALRVHTPTTLAYAAPMALFGTYGNLDGIVGDVQKDNWNTTDVLKSLLVNEETDLAATPSYVAANLFNKGVALRLIAMQVWGMLYVIGPSGSSEQGLEALRGKTVGVPMPNDMPDLVFRYLLGQKGWDVDSDLSKTPYTEGQDALNALLTALLAEELQQPIRYTTLEKYPIGEDVYSRLHYDLSTEARGDSLLQLLHSSPWGEDVPLSPTFTLHKVHTDLTTYLPPEGIDVIYYDAFSPEAQPELWDEVLFHRLYTAAHPGAKLTTYCAKGEVRRRLQRAGFAVERLAGPPGKREVLRATK